MTEGSEVFAYVVSVEGGQVAIKDFNGITMSIEQMKAEMQKTDKVIAEHKAELKKNTQEINATTKALNKLCEDLADAEAAEVKDLAKINDLKAGITGLNTELATQKQRQQETNAALEQATQKKQALVQGLQSATAAQKLLNQEQSNSTSVVAKLLGGEENLNNIMKAMPPGVRSVTTEFTGMTKAALAFLATPIGMVLGAIAVVLGTVYAALTRTVGGQEKMAKITGYLSGLFQGFMNIVTNVGTAIINAFENPQQAIKDFGKLIYDNIINRVKGIGDMFKAQAKVVESFLKLDWDGVKDGVKDMANAFIKVGTGVDDTIGKVAKLGAEVHKTGKTLAELSAQEMKLHQDESAWQVKEAELDEKIATARNKATTAKTEAERKQATAEAKQLIEEKYAKQEELATRARDIQKAKNDATPTAQEDIDALDEREAKVRQVRAAKQQELRFFERKDATMERQGETAQEKENAKKVRNAEKERQQEAYDAQQGRVARDLAFEVRQEEIKGMKDGFEKEREQLNLEYDKTIATLNDKADDMLKAIQDNEKRQWDIEHPDAAKEGLVFTPTTVELPADMQAQIEKLKQAADKQWQKGNEDIDKKELKERQEFLAPFGDFLQKEQVLREKYAEIRKKMYEDDGTTLKAGYTQANVDEVNRQEQEEKDNLAIEVASQNPEEGFEQWASDITQLSLSKLEEILLIADAELSDLEKKHANPAQIARARAQVATLQKQIKKVKGQKIIDTGKLDKAVKGIRGCTDAMRELGQVIGGTAGKWLDVISTVGDAVANTVDASKALVKSAASSMESTAAATSTAISTMEKGSAILAIISAAFQVFTALFNAFSGSNMDAMQADQDELTASNKDLQASIDSLKKSIDGGANTMEAYEKAMELTRQQEKNSNQIMIDEASKWERGSHSINSQANNDRGFMNLMSKAGNILGKNIGSSQDFLNLSAEDKKAIMDYDNGETWRQILASYRSFENDHTGEGIDEMLNEEIEKYGDAYKVLNEQMKEAFTRMTFDEFADNFESALNDMSKSADSFVDDFQDKINEAWNHQIMKQYEEPLQKVYDQLAKAIEAGDDAEIERLKAEYKQIVEEAKQTQKEYEELGRIEDTGSGEAEATTGQAMSITEDTAQDIVGRMTAIQISSDAQTATLQVGFAQMQEIGMQSIGYLASIAQNTGELYQMNARLGNILDSMALQTENWEDAGVYARRAYNDMMPVLTQMNDKIQQAL